MYGPWFVGWWLWLMVVVLCDVEDSRIGHPRLAARFPSPPTPHTKVVAKLHGVPTASPYELLKMSVALMNYIDICQRGPHSDMFKISKKIPDSKTGLSRGQYHSQQLVDIFDQANRSYHLGN